ncbi:MAG: nitrilase-related carbon-nitrogen hydrolase [Gammaproteobacteria bacterium]
MRVGFYQFRPVFGKVQKNLRKVLAGLQQVDADLIVLPELPFTGYYFRDRYETVALAEDLDNSSTIDGLKAVCRERDFYLVSGFAEKHRDKCFNSAVLIGPEGLLYRYRKLHLFNEEKNWFDQGDTPLQVNTIRDAKIGIMICFDWIFPEVSRILAMEGAAIICHPSNLVLSYCQQAMITRCIENRVFAITANRFGMDKRPHGEMEFTGNSQIVAADGERIFSAPSQRQMLYITDINPEQSCDKMITAYNDVMADRRPEYYRKLLS